MIAEIPSFIDERLTKVLENSVKTMKHFDVSFMPEQKFSNEMFAQLGMCCKLESINLSGNEKISHMQIERMLKGVYDDDINGYIRPQEQMANHFPNLQYVNFNQVLSVNDRDLQELA